VLAKVRDVKEVHGLKQRAAHRQHLQRRNSSILESFQNPQLLHKGKLNDQITTGSDLGRWPHNPDLPPCGFENIFRLDYLARIFENEKTAVGVPRHRSSLLLPF
jgi:hypothetical protein